MKILMICTKYETEGSGNSYLTNDLASAITELGHHITVAAIDWNIAYGRGASRSVESNGTSVLKFPPYAITRAGLLVERITKWTLSSLLSTLSMRRMLKGEKFDIVIGFSPATATAAQLLWAFRKTRALRYLVLWDFFPFYDRPLKQIPSRAVFKLAVAIETNLIRRFNVIGLMTPRNITYLRKHYSLRQEQAVEVLPIWGPPPVSINASRSDFSLPPDKKIAVMGGQLIRGRGIEDIILAAQLAAYERPDLAFCLIGSGEMEALIKEMVTEKGLGNLILKGRISRSEYLAALTVCDVALVCSDANVNVPNFPSKVIDYLRVGLPIIASVHASTDFGEIVEAHGAGCAAAAGQPAELLKAICSVVDDPIKRQKMAIAGKQWLSTELSASNVATQICNHAAIRNN